MKKPDEDEYREFVQSRLDRLRRTAYLLCRDWHKADDVVSITLTRLYRTWHRAREAGNLDAYVRAMLTNAFLDEGRRPWPREESTDMPPDKPDQATYPGVIDRATGQGRHTAAHGDGRAAPIPAKFRKTKAATSARRGSRSITWHLTGPAIGGRHRAVRRDRTATTGGSAIQARLDAAHKPVWRRAGRRRACRMATSADLGRARISARAQPGRSLHLDG